jgi:methyl-accepting chemotaxis protein
MAETDQANKKEIHRHPLGNFFIKKQLQMRLIARIVFAVLGSTVICLLCLLVVYYMRYKSVLMYQLTPAGDLTKENIVVILLPCLIIAGLVNIIVGILVGLYASRKYAVPIYKLEQWVLLLLKGRFNARLTFREKEEMKDLSNNCNLLATSLRRRFLDIKDRIDSLKKKGSSPDDIKAINESISDLELESDAIDVHTNFYTLPPNQAPGKTMK